MISRDASRIAFGRCARAVLAGILALSLALPFPGLAHAVESVQDGPEQTAPAADEPRDDCVPGEVVVVLDDAAASGARILSDDGPGAAAALGEQGLEIIEEVAPATEDTGTVLNVRVPEGATVDEAVAELEGVPGVAYAQPNYLYRLIDGVESTDEGVAQALGAEALTASGVNDPLCNDSTTYNANQYSLFQSKSVQAWGAAKSEGAVTVAVLDTGCRLDHVDLQGVVDAEHAYDTFNNAPLSEVAASGTVANGDAMGHGTHVSGIIGAATNNGVGMAGASYNAKVLPVKVFNDESGKKFGAPLIKIIEAYRYLTDLIEAGKVSNLRVVNLSLGLPAAKLDGETDRAFEQAINTMRENYGVLTVCAGGNGDEAGNPLTARSLPSDFDACLSVTSLDRDGGNTYWSDYNQYKDVSAPGTNITSASHSSANGYVEKSGTSMASPLVGGIAALLWAANPALTVDEVVGAIESTADPVVDSENDRSAASGSKGAIDAEAAVRSVKPVASIDPIDGAGAHRNLMLIVRFADSTIGDGATGYNEPYLNGVRPEFRTRWEYLTKQFNASAYDGYMGWGFRSYLAEVSGGMHDVVTDFPQTQADGTVAYLTLEGSPGSYSATSEGMFLSKVTELFNAQFPAYDAARVDGNADGRVDNIQIIVDGLTDENAWPYPAHSTTADVPDLTIGTGAHARTVFNYNVLPTFDSSAHWGTAVHEYLHTLGARDYYRRDENGRPVGIWDIMAVSARMSKPLALTREQLGWTAIPERSEAGTYTLQASGGEQAIMFKSPLNDAEYFVAEYRKKGEPVTGLDNKIGGSGLIVYRVNPAYAEQGNIAGNDYVYVFRSGETGVGDAMGDVDNAQITATGARTSIGSADMGADITQGALCYSDGRNSGIVIRATAETTDSVTFTVEYPDYTALGLWDVLENAGGTGGSLGLDASDVQMVADGQSLYALIEPSWGSGSGYRVMQHTGGTGWEDLGVPAAGGSEGGQLAACGGTVYFLVPESDGVVLKRLESGAWREVGRVRNEGGAFAAAPSLAFVGADPYVLVDRDYADAQLYRFDGSALVKTGPSLAVPYIVAPTVFELNGHPAVAYGSFPIGSGSTERSVVSELVGGAWVEKSSFGGCAHLNSVAYAQGSTYIYQYVDSGTDPRIVSFGADGALQASTALPRFKPCSAGGALLASGSRLYLAVVEGDGAGDPAKAWSADVGDLSSWKQLGGDVAAPVSRVSAAVWSDKVVVGVLNEISHRVDVRTHALEHSGAVDPPGPMKHKVTFRADGKVVDTVEFAEGDTGLSRVPVVPAKTGHTGSWPSYTLGTSDLVVDAVYTANSYRVTFKNWNGQALSAGSYLYGSRVQAPASPTRPSASGISYVFTGWAPSFTGICDQAKDMVYTAQYASVAVSQPQPLTYGYKTTSPVRLTVKNEGSVAIKNVVGSFDSGAGAFAFESSTIASLAPGQSAAIAVRPKAGLAAGLHTATVRVRMGANAAVSATCSVVQNVKKLDISPGVLYEAGKSKPGIAARTYTGKPQGLASGWRVVVSGVTVPTDQLSLTYKNNVRAGPATVEVSAKGSNVVGRFSVNFVIVPYALTAGNVTGVPAQMTFDGTALTPEPNVSVGGVKLTKGVDYDLTHENNVYAGTARVIVRGKGNYAGSPAVTFRIVRNAASVERLQGPIALDTMKAITTKGFPNGSCSTVVIATTSGYWDALTACGLAGVHRAPVLLTDGSSLSAQTASEIKRLGASNVLVAGGPAAVSDRVMSQMRALAGVKSVSRFAGATATGTAVKVFRGATGWSDTAIVATSKSFHDALSIAPYAYAKHAPIFLAESASGALSDETLAAVRAGGFKRVYVVGGTAAVAPSVQAQLGSLFAGRLAGPTAYETSLAIARWCADQGMSVNNVGIATGDTYYDALAGAALCGKNNAALVLVSDANRVTIDQFVKPRANQIARTYVFGGPAAVSAGTVDVLASAVR